MAQLLLPLILFGASAALFVVYTNPEYQKVQALQAEQASYDEALTKSQEVKKERDRLISRRNTFDTANLEKLEKILPDNVDNIRLVIDINNIAARHGISVSDVQLGTISDAAEARGASAVGASGSAVGSVELGFSFSSTYEDMLAFLVDLEHSLRIINVEQIGFTASPVGNTQEFTFKIRTFWLH